MGAIRRAISIKLAAIAVVTATASFTRFETIGQRPIWFDEALTYHFARSVETLSDVWRIGDPKHVDKHYDDQAPLQYLIAYGVLMISEDPVALRLPFALFGIASVVLLVPLGEALGRRSVGLTAAFLMAVSTYHVIYSMDARPYGILMAATQAQFLCFFAFVTRPKVSAWFGFVVAGVVGTYATHSAWIVQVLLVGVIGLIFGATSFAAWRRRRRGVPREISRGEPNHRRTFDLRNALLLLSAPAAIVLCYAPRFFSLAWLFESERAAELHTLSVTPKLLFQLVSLWGSGPGWTVPVYGTLVALGIARCLAFRDVRTSVVVWLFGPAIPFAVLPFSHFFDARYLIAALPAFYLLVALGLDTLRDLLSAIRRSSPTRRRFVPAGIAVAALTLLLASQSMIAYGAYRRTERRCGDFFWDESLVTANDGFCRKHFLLNSLHPDDAYLLRRWDGR